MEQGGTATLLLGGKGVTGRKREGGPSNQVLDKVIVTDHVVEEN
jgi:hypothetical protein